ncbi:hypothetical protein [Arthrobacter sp. SO3]|uniref:hypothetical protein n=1 Tax=Arthrobacter sp. SO3 TaxID=1897057 RepID=UPI001CFFAED0|nr:hypothetical protein [Arthrobacter sp. SO3]MCB5291000.1 hypothetical protein [Arthrobacter sp. SO3]
MTAASASLTSAVSTSFNIAAGPAAKLVLTTRPSGAPVNSVFATQPVVAIHDAGGNNVTAGTATVTLSITPPPGSANLTCTVNPLAAASGVAAFAGCKIDKKGTNNTLTASSGTLTAAVSAPFNIS